MKSIHSDPCKISEFLLKTEENIHFDVKLCDLSQITEWYLDDEKHYAHTSGRFFKICGVSKSQNNPHIIRQPEIGLLCLFRTYVEGEWLYLLQAKAEPGNVRPCLWAPTIQATRSNFTRMHKGKTPDYYDVYDVYIKNTSSVFCDALLPEQGNVYWQKYNRNVILNVDYFDPKPGFIWVRGAHLGLPTILEDSNSCLKSTLSLILINKDNSTSIQSLGLINYFAEGKGLVSVRHSSNFLLEPKLYSTSDYSFDFIGAKIEISGRENSTWQQPLIKCTGRIDNVALRVRQPDGRSGWIFNTNYEVGYLFGYKLGLLPKDWDIKFPNILKNFGLEVIGEKKYKLNEEGGRFSVVTTNVTLVEVYGNIVNSERFGSLIYLDDGSVMGANHLGLIEMDARSMFFIGNVT